MRAMLLPPVLTPSRRPPRRQRRLGGPGDFLPATVNSVTISQTGGEMMLNLAGGMGSVKLSKVQTIGI
jgi:hypothetical protein